MNLDVQIDPAVTAFSRFGSYIAFSEQSSERCKKKGIPEGLWMRCIHADAVQEDVFRIEMIEDGISVPFTSIATPSCLTLTSAKGHAEVILPTHDIVRIRVTGVTLRLTVRDFRNHAVIPETDGSWVINTTSAFRAFRLVPLSGQLAVDAPWTTKHCEHIIVDISPESGDVAELAIEEMTWERPRYDHSNSFETVKQVVVEEFRTFSEPFLKCEESLRNASLLAAYVNWASVVHPHGLLKRPTMYMSKNWMTNVWAWDHAFNALAVSLTDEDLAWDQFMVIFDHQHETGQIPDFINDVRYLTRFVKPPIHGWILSRMVDFGFELSGERLQTAYDKLTKWTNWWLNHRNPDGDGLPVYWHGNDSGWDNCTVFDVPPPFKSPDLAAFLITQMDYLAVLADMLDRPDDAGDWRRRADATLSALIDTLWDGERFQCISTRTGEEANPSDSVFNCLPIILGNRLPTDITTKIVDEIKRHLTAWGPATEHPDSPVYDPDGYWRGPIWAPSTFILIDGLRRASETELARDISERFCKLCVKSGVPENFDALTGAPLRDRGYTWTSSVFLVLANHYI